MKMTFDMASITMEELTALHWDGRLNQRQIAERLGCSQAYISLSMKRLNVPHRTSAEAITGFHKWGGHRKCPWISESNKRTPRLPKGQPHPWQSEISKRLWQTAKIDGRSMGRKRNVEKCLECGKSFYAMPCKKRQYCSVKCRAIAVGRQSIGKIVSEETRRKLSEIMRKDNRFLLLNKDPVFQRKRMKGLSKKPTRPEKRLAAIIDRHNLPFKYVGDGEMIVGKLIPDFIHTIGEKKVIEVFGRIYHDPESSYFDIDWSRQYWGRLAYYGQLGYDCLILWDDELSDEGQIVNRVRIFGERLE